jgi:hypothetical protein
VSHQRLLSSISVMLGMKITLSRGASGAVAPDYASRVDPAQILETHAIPREECFRGMLALERRRLENRSR